jgi:hypothetical protein
MPWFTITEYHSKRWPKWAVEKHEKILIRASAPQYYDLLKVHVGHLRVGDWFADALQLGRITKIESQQGEFANVVLSYRIETEDAAPDAWGADQWLNVYRAVAKPASLEPRPVTPDEALDILRKKLADKGGTEYTLDLTAAEAGVLKEVFNRFLAGSALYGDGPLKNVHRKIDAIPAPRTATLFNRNRDSARTVQVWSEYLQKDRDRSMFANAITILEYVDSND